MSKVYLYISKLRIKAVVYLCFTYLDYAYFLFICLCLIFCAYEFKRVKRDVGLWRQDV